MENAALSQSERGVGWTQALAPEGCRSGPVPTLSSSSSQRPALLSAATGWAVFAAELFCFQDPTAESPRKGQSGAELLAVTVRRRHGEPLKSRVLADQGVPGANTPFIIMTGENASAAFLSGTRGEGKIQTLCWEPDNKRLIEGWADTNRNVQSVAIPQHPEGGRAATHLGGGEDDDVLDVSPGETRPHLQHQRDHPRGEGSGGRRPSVALRAARALLQVPVCCHLPGKSRGAAGQAAEALLWRSRGALCSQCCLFLLCRA